MARSSANIINGWYPAQCPNLPINLDNIKNIYNENYKKTFNIFSTDKRIKISTGTATKGIQSSILITITALLINSILV